MRGVIRLVMDRAVDRPILLYVLAALFSAAAIWLIPIELIRSFVSGSIPAIPGVAFSLFGFAITAVSILVSLKGSPFFDLLQRERFGLWKALIGAFIHEASLFSAFGIITLLLTAETIKKIVGLNFVIFAYIYIFIFLSVILATMMAVYLLRLVANVPPIDQQIQPNIDTSALNGFVDPTSLHPPRRL